VLLCSIFPEETKRNYGIKLLTHKHNLGMANSPALANPTKKEQSGYAKLSLFLWNLWPPGNTSRDIGFV